MRTTQLAQSLNRLRETGLPVEEVLDVGAQAGTAALVQVFGDKRHHLFEPDAQHHAKLAAGYADIDHRLVAYSVGEQDRPPGGSEPPTLCLDSYVAETHPKAPFLLKVDVRGAGAPAAVLRGAAETLRHSSCVVIQMTIERYLERATALESAGFDLWDLTRLCYYGDCLWQWHGVYVKRSYKTLLPDLHPMRQQPFDIGRWQGGA